MPSSACNHTATLRAPHPFPTRRSSDLAGAAPAHRALPCVRRRHHVLAARRGAEGALRDSGERSARGCAPPPRRPRDPRPDARARCCGRSEEHMSELQSLTNLVCRLLLVTTPLPSALRTLSLHDALPI